MTLVPLPNNHFAVSVPEGAKGFTMSYDKTWLWYDGSKAHLEYIDLGPGSYTIVGLASEVTEEQAGKVVDKSSQSADDFYETVYPDYTVPGRYVLEPIESFRSLLLSLSLDKNVLIIKQNK